MKPVTIPLKYDQENILGSTCNPSGVVVHNTMTAAFFRRYLLERAKSVFVWKLPKAWDKNYFLNSLYCGGTVAIVNTDAYGVIPQYGYVSGYNVQYQPYKVQITNPLLKGILQPIIGKQCSLFRMTSNYGNIMDIISFFADYLALLFQSAGVNIINTKLAWAFLANDQRQADSFKKAADNISSGDPFVVINKTLAKDNRDGVAIPFFEQSVKNNFIVPELLDAVQTVTNMFDSYIGIPNANTQKKERMVVDEANAKQVESITMADMWLDSWKESIEQTVELFGEDQRAYVEWRIQPGNKEGGESDEKSDDVDSRSV